MRRQHLRRILGITIGGACGYLLSWASLCAGST